MQSFEWTPAHCEALREHFARGLSFAEIAAAINARFGTAYTRSATIGRARRMGLARSDRPKGEIERLSRQLQKAKAKAKAPRPVRRVPEAPRPRAVFEPVKVPKLRCVEIEPRHLSLLDLKASDCRYPYGGDADGEAITFCGHPQREGSSYCVPHFHLTRGPGSFAERTAGAVLLWLVTAA
jgi:GcrA cell cycle regulator